MATLALKIKQLKAFVHVSTAYVNCNLPRGSHIEEQIYPLYHKNGKMVEHKALAMRLADMPPAKAEAEVCFNLAAEPHTKASFACLVIQQRGPCPQGSDVSCAQKIDRGCITLQCRAACMCGPLNPATYIVLSGGLYMLTA